jgi:LPS-assembly protein
VGLLTEYNHFTLQGQDLAAGDTRGDGHRLHALASVQLNRDLGWAWLNPKFSLNAAAYDTDTPMRDGARRAARSVPTLSVDSGLRLERDSSLLDSPVRQTLEPRLHYVNTPWRDQGRLPNYDAAALDFNEISIYGDNAFSGGDFVADAHRVTMGATSRWFDQRRGAELLRFGLAQRLLLRDPRITAANLTADGLTAAAAQPPSRFSDILLFGSTSLLPRWRFDGTLRFDTDASRTMRSILSARWQPGPFQTIAATYRFTRGLNEQFELGWQWPLYRGQVGANAGSCSGKLYGVGRVNYSKQDSRVTDAIAGLEYDAGCWIGRLVFERTSTSRAEARQHVYLQLELAGLSKLGPSPLKVLKDNIPGYQLLRDDPAAPSISTAP